jgi:hypothetical protein
MFTGFGYLLMPEELPEWEIVKTPTYKEVGGVWYVYMDLTGPKSQMGEKSTAFLNECRNQGIKSVWHLLIFYNWTDEDDDTVIKWIRGKVVPENTKVKPPLKIAKLEKFKAMVYTHTGSLETAEISKSNKFLSKYIVDQGLKELWPNYELIRGDPPQVHLWYLVEGMKEKDK